MNIKVFSTIVVTFSTAVSVMLYLGQTNEAPQSINPANIVHKTINMKGMTSDGCEIAIDKVVRDRGMVKVRSSKSNQKVEVEYDKTQTNIKTVMQNIKNTGFIPVSYEDETGLHNVNDSMKTEMKCGAGKCGGAE